VLIGIEGHLERGVDGVLWITIFDLSEKFGHLLYYWRDDVLASRESIKVSNVALASLQGKSGTHKTGKASR